MRSVHKDYVRDELCHSLTTLVQTCHLCDLHHRIGKEPGKEDRDPRTHLATGQGAKQHPHEGLPRPATGASRCRLGAGIGWIGPEGPQPTCTPTIRANFQGILRKEVIQPQVPLRLPCYDLVPITGFIFGACLAAPATSDAPRFGGLTGGVYKAQEHIHRGMLIRDY